VVGGDPEVVERLVAARHGTAGAVVPTPESSRDLRRLRSLRAAIAAGQPDVVHVNLTWPLASWHAQLALLTYRAPVVVLHEHLPTRFRHRVYRVVKQALSRRADRHVVVSAAAADVLAVETGLDRSRLTVVPNGVQVPERSLAGRTATGPPVVTSVGRFTAQKGFDVLLRALASVPGAVLHVVGARSPEETDWVRGLADQSGVADRVRVLPWTDRLATVLEETDVVAIASRAEAAQLVLLEALAAGLPVVSTRVGSAEEVLGRLDDRLLVPVEDPDALARALRLVLSDRDLRQDVGQRGRHLVLTEYTTAAVCRRFEELYETSAAARRG
jgi:glycosyltransferase involved in cell wall biosynthesis